MREPPAGGAGERSSFMIFNTPEYFLFFLIPCALLFRLVAPRLRPWVCATGGAAFFLYFAHTLHATWLGPACLVIFLWESIVSRWYRPGSPVCIFGVVQAV